MTQPIPFLSWEVGREEERIKVHSKVKAEAIITLACILLSPCPFPTHVIVTWQVMPSGQSRNQSWSQRLGDRAKSQRPRIRARLPEMKQGRERTGAIPAMVKHSAGLLTLPTVQAVEPIRQPAIGHFAP